MRRLGGIGAVCACAILIGACGANRAVPISAAHQQSFSAAAAALLQRWNGDLAEGVPAASLAPLRQELRASPLSAAQPDSALWSDSDGSALLAELSDRTAAAWSSAVSAAEERLQAALRAWDAMATGFGADVPAAALAAHGAWTAQLDSAVSPAAMDALSAAWLHEVDADTAAAHTAQLDRAQQALAAQQAAAASARPHPAAPRAASAPRTPPPPPAPTPLGCGAAVPWGKVMVVSLSQQSAVFYENRCSVNSSLVTTGRPGMRTPMGTFHIFNRASPAHFASGYPPSSPRYYTPQTTQFAMAYAGGGFYLHDAPWEPAGGFGPGSDNGPSASHGCIHVPTAVMAWLFGWGSMGTTVIVTS